MFEYNVTGFSYRRPSELESWLNEMGTEGWLLTYVSFAECGDIGEYARCIFQRKKPKERTVSLGNPWARTREV